MTVTEQIYAQSLLLLQDLKDSDEQMLMVLCRCAENSLTSKLKDGLTPSNCKADFVAAASLYAVAAMSEQSDAKNPQQVNVGDLTIRKSDANPAACCLRYQAEMLIAPYLKDNFAFLGV